MGTTFQNCHVRSDDAEPVIVALREVATGDCYVTAEPAGGWISIYPDEWGQRLAEQLSARLQTAALFTFEYDSDVFGYTLYENGENRDEFDSDPDFGVGESDENGEPIPPKTAEELAAVRGDPQTLLPYCIPGATSDAVRFALGLPREESTASPYSIFVRQDGAMPEQALAEQVTGTAATISVGQVPSAKSVAGTVLQAVTMNILIARRVVDGVSWGLSDLLDIPAQRYGERYDLIERDGTDFAVVKVAV